MHRNGKPVRKCHGCGLNFRDHCGVFSSPHDQWHSRKRCPGYKNEEMLAEYLDQQERDAQDEAKERRRIETKMVNAEHHNGDRHVVIATS